MSVQARNSIVKTAFTFEKVALLANDDLSLRSYCFSPPAPPLSELTWATITILRNASWGEQREGKTTHLHFPPRSVQTMILWSHHFVIQTNNPPMHQKSWFKIKLGTLQFGKRPWSLTPEDKLPELSEKLESLWIKHNNDQGDVTECNKAGDDDQRTGSH